VVLHIASIDIHYVRVAMVLILGLVLVCVNA